MWSDAAELLSPLCVDFFFGKLKVTALPLTLEALYSKSQNKQLIEKINSSFATNQHPELNRAVIKRLCLSTLPCVNSLLFLAKMILYEMPWIMNGKDVNLTSTTQ